jgi:hypothetical protein
MTGAGILSAELRPQLPSGRFSGREDFRQLVRDAIATAVRDDWSEMVFSDAHFHDWPLGERAVVDLLQQWARGGRHLTLLACSYDEVVRRHARFVNWRRTWDHIITCRRSPMSDVQDMPSALWSPHWVLHRLDPERCAGVTGVEPDRRVLLKEMLSERISRRSSPGFPATTLGL